MGSMRLYPAQRDNPYSYSREFGDNGRIGFAFYLATLFRDVVTYASAEHWFPILNLFVRKVVVSRSWDIRFYRCSR